MHILAEKGTPPSGWAKPEQRVSMLPMAADGSRDRTAGSRRTVEVRENPQLTWQREVSYVLERMRVAPLPD